MGSNQSRCDPCTQQPQPQHHHLLAHRSSHQIPYAQPAMSRPIPIACKQPAVPIKREHVYFQHRQVVYPSGRQSAPYGQQAYGCQPNMQPLRKSMSCCYTPQPPQCQPSKVSSAPPTSQQPPRPYSCHQPSLSCPPQVSYAPHHHQQHQQPQQRQSIAGYPPQQSYYYNNCAAQYQYYNNSNCSAPYNSSYNCNRCPNVY